MKRPSIYVKMKVLGAIDVVEGKTRHERIHHVAQMTFLDEEGAPHRFTWRTIQTWYYRYKNHGVTGMNNSSRADKGQARKVTPEEVLEAINAALPHFHQKRLNKSAIYRFCIEKGLLHANQIALTTFCRFVREYELLKEDVGENRRRLAFSMQHANQLWQADTMFGPQVLGANGQRRQAAAGRAPELAFRRGRHQQPGARPRLEQHRGRADRPLHLRRPPFDDRAAGHRRP